MAVHTFAKGGAQAFAGAQGGAGAVLELGLEGGWVKPGSVRIWGALLQAGLARAELS